MKDARSRDATPGRGGYRPGAGRPRGSKTNSQKLPVTWRHLLESIDAAEAALMSVYVEIKVSGRARSAKESLAYARQLIRLASGAENPPPAFVEAKRLNLMCKRLVAEVSK